MQYFVCFGKGWIYVEESTDYLSVESRDCGAAEGKGFETWLVRHRQNAEEALRADEQGSMPGF